MIDNPARIGGPLPPSNKLNLDPLDLEDQWHSPTSRVCSKDREENWGEIQTPQEA